MKMKKAEHATVYSKEILDEFETAQGKLIPAKSKDLYEKEYEKFCEWRCAKNISSCDEKVVMAYISQMVRRKLTIMPIVFINNFLSV